MSFEIIAFRSVILEIRPRLRSVNAFIKFNNILSNSPIIILEEQLIKIISETASLTIPCNDFIIIPNSLTNINWNDNSLIFRFSTKNIVQDRGCFKTELLLNTIESIESLSIKPLLMKNTSYIICCSNCNKALTETIKFKRILPLPSDKSHPSEWFCHHNENNFDVSPKIDDIFYTHCYTHLHVSNVPFVKSSGKMFVCKYCLNWIGVRCDKNTLKLWHNTVKFLNNTTCVETSCLSDVFHSIRNTLNDNTTVKIIITCQTNSENLDVLLLWLMEKKLQILSKDSDNFKQHDVAKVLFKFVNCHDSIYSQWHNDCMVHIISVSKPMLIALLKHLHKCNTFFPGEYSISNDFLVSYMFLYD